MVWKWSPNLEARQYRTRRRTSQKRPPFGTSTTTKIYPNLHRLYMTSIRSRSTRILPSIYHPFLLRSTCPMARTLPPREAKRLLWRRPSPSAVRQHTDPQTLVSSATSLRTSTKRIQKALGLLKATEAPNYIWGRGAPHLTLSKGIYRRWVFRTLSRARRKSSRTQSYSRWTQVSSRTSNMSFVRKVYDPSYDSVRIHKEGDPPVTD